MTRSVAPRGTERRARHTRYRHVFLAHFELVLQCLELLEVHILRCAHGGTRMDALNPRRAAVCARLATVARATRHVRTAR
eukprot:6219125-Prymnesium_polylepis.1